MIQFKQTIYVDSSSYEFHSNKVYLNLYDKLEGTYEAPQLNPYSPLWGATSQFTGKTKYWVASTSWAAFSDKKQRYVEMVTLTTYGEETMNRVKFGTTDFPLGFYDITIYQNSSNSNTDPTGLNVIYNGLMNLVAINVNAATNEKEPISPVVYTQYTANDSETESIYITNSTQ